MRALRRALEFIFFEQAPYAVVGEDGAVLADEVGAVLAVAAESDGAFHVAFHGEVDVAGRDAAVLRELGDDVAHHDFGSADQDDGAAGMQAEVAEERGDDADAAAPVDAAVIDGGEHLAVGGVGPGGEFLAVEEVAGAAGAVEEDEAGVLVAVAEDVVDGGAQRGEADAAGDDEDVLAAGLGERPGGAEGAAHAERVARAAADQRVGGGADGADGVDETAGMVRVAADGDGQLADAEDVEHAELAGGEAGRFGGGGGVEGEGEGVGGFAQDGFHPVGMREHRVHRVGSGGGGEVVSGGGHRHPIAACGWLRGAVRRGGRSASAVRSRDRGSLRTWCGGICRRGRWRGRVPRRARRDASSRVRRPRTSRGCRLCSSVAMVMGGPCGAKISSATRPWRRR